MESDFQVKEYDSVYGENLDPYALLSEELRSKYQMVEPQEVSLIDEPNEVYLIVEPQEEPLIDEFKEELSIDEPKEEPLIDEFKEDLTIDKPNEVVSIDEPKEEPLIDEFKEDLTIDEPNEVVSIDDPKDVLSSNEPREVLSIDEPNEVLSIDDSGEILSDVEEQSEDDSRNMVLRYDEDSDPPISIQQLNDERIQYQNQTLFTKNAAHDAIPLVQNIQSYLDNSNRFCKTCLILFPTELAKLNHNKNHLLTESETNVFLYVCHFCDKNFTTISNLEKHIKTVHTKNITENVHKTNESNTNFSCNHCTLKFPNAQLLIAHLYAVVGRKRRNRDALYNNETVQQQDINSFGKVMSDNDVLNSDIPNTYVYRCRVCSYYLKNIKMLVRHMKNKHKSKKPALPKKMLYDPKCKFCPSQFSKLTTYNIHIYRVHRNKLCSETSKKSIKPRSTPKHDKKAKKDVCAKTNSFKKINEEDPPAVGDTEKNQEYILKSVLFKCNRCDIHFLNSQVAKDHVSHMVILTNWTCSRCKLIFKKNDEKNHMLQHMVTNDFTMYDISDSSPLVLYICSKCSVHFDEDNYFKHFPVCRSDYFMHAECEDCGIWLDVNLNCHNCYFQAGSSKSTGFITVKTDLIKKDTMNQDLGNMTNDLTVNSKVLRTGNISNDMSTKTSKLFKSYYCKNCKCFVNHCSITKHKTAKCKDFVDPIVCLSCGLIYPKKCTSSHARLHKKNLNLTLLDFEFYDLNSEHLINPPFPEFPQCGACEIHFAQKNDEARHCCGAEEYTICSACNLKFSEIGYKIHMYYHDLTSSHTNRNEECPSKRTKYDYKIYQCKKCQICISNEVSSRKHICSSRILKSKCSICGLYWQRSNLKSHNALHISDSNFIIDNITLIDINSDSKLATTSTSNRVIENLETIVSSPNEVVQQKTNSVQGKVVNRKLFRCPCELHFLDRVSTLAHINTTCLLKKNVRRQKCSKCGFSFDADEFFKHLVKHHSDNEEITKFQIIDIVGKSDKRQYYK